MLPHKIEICPIVDTVVEIRFSSTIFSNAVFGMVYSEFQKDYPRVEKLPILQLPDQLREIDPNLKFKPHYRISDGKYTIQIGPDVFTIGSPIPYVGWPEFSEQIYSLYLRLFKLNIISNVLRLGVRYVNFFEDDIFSKIKLSLSIDNNEHKSKNTLIRTEIDKNGFTNTIHIANDVTRAVGSKVFKGSIIDIDTSRNYIDARFLTDFKNEVESAHSTEKELFFSLLKDDFLKFLKPIYYATK